MVSGAAEFSNQYNLSYATRLNHMKELIISNPAMDEYSLPMKKLSDASYDECIVIAILFVSSTAKYSILRPNDNIDSDTYFNEDSQVLLEDSSGKVQVIFKSRSLDKLKFLSSGIVLGFVGCKNEKNIFECCDFIFPKPLSSSLLSAGNTLSANGSPKKVLILSNVCLSKGSYEKARLLVVFYSSKVDEIIIFGNLLSDDATLADVQDFNSLVADISCTVSIVPGSNDLTSKMLPQQPLPKMLFDNKLEHIKFLPHPCKAKVLGKNFVLINSEIIKDLMKYRPSRHVLGSVVEAEANASKPIDLLEQLVKIRHIAPNCPDTLSCIPFSDRDPFIISECDYLIAGGTTAFAHRIYNGVTLVCAKDFQLGDSAVLIDIGTNTLTEIELDGF